MTGDPIPAGAEELYRKVRGVKAVYERENYGNYVLLEISTDTSPQEVLDDLRKVKHLKVVGYEGQSVRAKYRR